LNSKKNIKNAEKLKTIYRYPKTVSIVPIKNAEGIKIYRKTSNNFQHCKIKIDYKFKGNMKESIYQIVYCDISQT